MSGGEDRREAYIEQATWHLDQGLKSCRSVVDNYRAMLSRGSVANDCDERLFDGEDDPYGFEAESN